MMTRPDLNPSTSLSEQIEDDPSYQDIDSEQPTAPNITEQSGLDTEGHFYATPSLVDGLLVSDVTKVASSGGRTSASAATTRQFTSQVPGIIPAKEPHLAAHVQTLNDKTSYDPGQIVPVACT